MSVKLNKFLKAVIVCSEEKRYSILKVIESLGKTNYTILMNVVITNMPQKHRSDFAFHMRKLRKYGVIVKDPQTRGYVITKTGEEVLKMLNKYQEKYIIEDDSLICKNDHEESHNFVKICSKCGFIQKEILAQ